jgi:purine-binding chemotaxis protein CheW
MAPVKGVGLTKPDPKIGGKYLTFRIGMEDYGIDILCVQEIRSWEQPTRLATAARYIKGVINLRGVIVPIVDLRMKFGTDAVEYTAVTAVIIMDVQGKSMGAVVDSVSDVVALTSSEVKSAPSISCGIERSVITGIGTAKVEGYSRMLIMLDIQALLQGCVAAGE